MFLKIKTYILILIISICSFNLYSSPKTYGYIKVSPNEFWPTPFANSNGSGNQIQQTTASNNPDVFCATQGSNYRLPSNAEFSRMAVGLAPNGSGNAHWSHYVNFQVPGVLIPKETIRKVNGGLWNEWGSLNNYGNGWENSYYWVTEPTKFNYSPNPGGGGTSAIYYGRLSHSASSGSYPALSARGNTTSFNTYLKTNLSFYVAFVRDLISTPATPSPGFS